MRAPRIWKALLPALAGLALALPAAALAAPVQQFSFQVTDLKPGGRYTLLFTARNFDTTGGVPATPTENYLRLPVGATLRKQFLTKRYFCDGPKLRTAIDLWDFTGTPFTKRVANLKPFIRQLARSRDRRERRELANAQACDRARIGGGTAKIDARESFPTITDLIRASFSMFLSKPAPGAVAGFTVLAAADEDQPIVQRRSYEVITGVHAALAANFFDDPTPDGLYGYRLDLPRGEVNGFKVSIAELFVTTKGLTLLRGTCLKQRNGRCVKRQARTLFWFTTPSCPPSGLLSIEQFFGYADPALNVTKTIQLACPRFR